MHKISNMQMNFKNEYMKSKGRSPQYSSDTYLARLPREREIEVVRRKGIRL